MIDDYGSKRSMVIPKWVSFSKATESLELSIPRKEPFELNSFTRRQLEEDYLDFKDSPTPHKASDLMGSALVIGELDIAEEAAKFVLHKSNLEEPTKSLSRKILMDREADINILKINIQISKAKSFLFNYPKHSIGWIEIARLYTIKGQIKKAKRAAFVALNLSPSDRYIVRSAARFYIHIGELETALYFIKNALNDSPDPWIKAMDISVSNRLNKGIGSPKRLLPANPSFKEIFHHSELFESFGMLELNTGNIRRAKKNFRVAWTNPSESVIRHGEWVIRNELPGLKDDIELDISQSHEALSWHLFYNYQLKEALESVIEWELDEPYSASPYLIGSSIAISQNDYDNAIKFAKRGLSANPSHFMLYNNLCYSLINAERLDEAEEYLKKVKSFTREEDLLFYHATTGLYTFKRGDFKKGRELYLKSIERCKEMRDSRLLANASLNQAIAENEANTQNKSRVIKEALRIAKDIEDPFIHFLRSKLQSIIKKK